MSNSKFDNIKVHVPTPYISKLVQEKLFQLGYGWYLGGGEVKYTDKPYLYTDSSLISYGTNSTNFRQQLEKQVHYLQILTEALEGKLFKYTEGHALDYVFYLSKGYAFWVDQSKEELTSVMFESEYYNHIKGNIDGIVNLNVNEEVIEVNTSTSDIKIEEKTMIINELDYISVDSLSLKQLQKFEKHCNDQGYDSMDTSEDVINFWNHYGVFRGGLEGYDEKFVDNCGVDITEQFLEYLNSLEDGENDKGVEEQVTSTEEKDNNLLLTVKERLLALADGKELEWYDVEDSCCYKLETYQSDFGDILYDESIKVRVKAVPEKSELEVLFEEYCFDSGYDPEHTDFTTFKAGYEAAKNNDR